jgi:hypothetical protein
MVPSMTETNETVDQFFESYTAALLARDANRSPECT